MFFICYECEWKSCMSWGWWFFWLRKKAMVHTINIVITLTILSISYFHFLYTHIFNLSHSIIFRLLLHFFFGCHSLDGSSFWFVFIGKFSILDTIKVPLLLLLLHFSSLFLLSLWNEERKSETNTLWLINRINYCQLNVH